MAETADTSETTSAPSNTVAIIVEVSSAGGAMNVGRPVPTKLGMEFVDRVGLEDAENIVVIAWQPEWRYYTIGNVGIKYVVEQGHVT